jgi:hypothetical protein
MRIYSYVTSEKSWLTIVKLFPLASLVILHINSAFCWETLRSPLPHIYLLMHACTHVRATLTFPTKVKKTSVVSRRLLQDALSSGTL